MVTEEQILTLPRERVITRTPHKSDNPFIVGGEVIAEWCLDVRSCQRQKLLDPEHEEYDINIYIEHNILMGKTADDLIAEWTTLAARNPYEAEELLEMVAAVEAIEAA